VESTAVRSERPLVSVISILVPMPDRWCCLYTCTSAISRQSASQVAAQPTPTEPASAVQTASYHH